MWHAYCDAFFEVTKDADVPYIYKVIDDLDAANVDSLRPELDRLSLINDDLTLDVASVRFMDSSGVGAIVFLLKRLRARGYKIALCGLQGQPLKLLQHLGITALVMVEPNANVA